MFEQEATKATKILICLLTPFALFIPVQNPAGDSRAEVRYSPGNL
jgi:hypothetical protein